MDLRTDSKKLIQLLKMFYWSTGIGMGVYSPEDELIALYPEQYGPFCKLMRETERTRIRCEECDREAFERCKENQVVEIYSCHAGLTEVLAPLRDDSGDVFGYISFGQLPCHEDPAVVRDRLEKTLQKYQLPPDSERIEAFLAYAPYKSYAQIISMAGIMEICAKHITTERIITPLNSPFRSMVEIFVDNHLTQKISVDQLCREMAVSRSSFFEHFKQEFGVSFSYYVNQKRLRKVKELLQTTELSLSEIAAKCGFASTNYLCKVFMKAYHISPHQYRLMYASTK